MDNKTKFKIEVLGSLKDKLFPMDINAQNQEMSDLYMHLKSTFQDVDWIIEQLNVLNSLGYTNFTASSDRDNHSISINMSNSSKWLTPTGEDELKRLEK